MLITFAEVGEALGVSPTDAQLIRAVKSTDQWARQNLGRQFKRDTYTLYPRGYGRNVIWIRESPVRAITEIRIDPYGRFGDDTIVTDLTRFRWNPDPFDDDNKIEFFGGGWFGNHSSIGRWWWPFPELTNAIKITVEAGWWLPDDEGHADDYDLPEDLREKLIERARIKYLEANDDFPEEMQSTREGDRSLTKFEQTDTRILRELRRYRR